MAKLTDKPTWSERELRGLYQEYLTGARASDLAKRRGRTSGDLLFMFEWRRWPLRARPSPRQPKRVDERIVQAMYAEYMAGITFAETERRHGRRKGTARVLFVGRGLPLRESEGLPVARRADGSFAPFVPLTEDEIEELVAGATKLAIPERLRLEWRKWPLERRGDFIARVRARLKDPGDRPELPFSSNVEPFDYATPKAWEMIRARNAGLSSKHWKTMLKVPSQGVIWDGRFWFWARKESHYYEGIAWRLYGERPALHRTIWESIHGPIPPLGVVRCADGNPNNLDPSNLVLTDRNELCRENQARALTEKSRDLTTILLNRHQSNTPHAHPDTLQVLARR